MISLTPLESDILGDMASDSHNVGELVGFIRSDNPHFTDSDIFRDLINLLSTWIDRGWLSVVAKPSYGQPMASVAELIPYLEHHGVAAVAVESDIKLPEVDLTKQAFLDVEWLRGAV